MRNSNRALVSAIILAIFWLIADSSLLLVCATIFYCTSLILVWMEDYLFANEIEEDEFNK